MTSAKGPAQLELAFGRGLDAMLAARGRELWIIGIDSKKRELVDICGTIGRIHGSHASDADCLQSPRNRLRLTAESTDPVVHSGGHKSPTANCGNPYFAGFLELSREGGRNPTLSAKNQHD